MTHFTPEINNKKNSLNEIRTHIDTSVVCYFIH